MTKKLEDELRVKDMVQGKLESTAFVLKTKSSEENIQARTLNNLIQEYKDKLLERAQHIHPMLYEEQQSFAQRAYENEQIWRK